MTHPYIQNARAVTDAVLRYWQTITVANICGPSDLPIHAEARDSLCVALKVVAGMSVHQIAWFLWRDHRPREIEQAIDRWEQDKPELTVDWIREVRGLMKQIKQEHERAERERSAA